MPYSVPVGVGDPGACPLADLWRGAAAWRGYSSFIMPDACENEANVIAIVKRIGRSAIMTTTAGGLDS